MSEDKDATRVIDKIKKCLALAGSDNEHEAAQALKHAQALMRRYGVDEASIADADLLEADVPARSASAKRPSAWEAHLLSLVGKTFGCLLTFTSSVRKGSRAPGRYTYIGLHTQAAVAAYTATVLLRELRAARKRHIAAEKLRRGTLKRREVTRLGDAFCAGWLSRVEQQVTAFANPKNVEAAIGARMARRCGEREAKPGKFAKRYDAASLEAGLAAGEAVRLHRPMNEAQPPALSHPTS